MSDELDAVLLAFGMAVRSRRVALGISQEELALRAGLARSYITEIEHGTRNLALRNIARIARALQVDLSELFQDIGSLRRPGEDRSQR